MQIVADLEVHSKYARAVSQKMNLQEISSWASRKGINLVGTGDWTHPLWFREIIKNLKEISPGIFTLKNPPASQKHTVKFALSCEVNCIYSQGGKGRRIHNLIYSPSLKTCEKVIQELTKRGGKLMADGRPILGISSQDLLEMLLGIDERILFIPAHVWTPWYGYYGSMSGFDSLEEGFGKLSKYIYAMETGLSSDPWMNWQIKELETRSIVSFSDAHSAPKLGREATVFVSNSSSNSNSYSYADIADAIKQKPDAKFKIGYTIEFFPEEGKYHWSGHRSCGIRYSPKETKEKGTTCPVCHRSLTIGVENRVNDLSYKTLTPDDLLYVQNSAGLTFVYDKEKKRRPFVSAVPLQEMLVEMNGGSQIKGLRQYEEITEKATEFDILLRMNYEEIARISSSKVAQGVKNIRERKLKVDPGYDGVFGTVKIFSEDEKEPEPPKENQNSLF